MPSVLAKSTAVQRKEFENVLAALYEVDEALARREDAVVRNFSRHLSRVRTAVEHEISSLNREVKKGNKSEQEVEWALSHLRTQLGQIIHAGSAIAAREVGEGMEKLYENISQLTELDEAFRRLDNLSGGTGTLSKVLPFDAAMRASQISDRFAHYGEEYAGKIEEIVTEGILRGHTWGRMRGEVRRATNILNYQAERIVRTESIAAHHESRAEKFIEAGVEYAAWVATEDDRLCGYCAARAGKIYAMSEVVIPAHPNCRCTVMPIRPEWLELGLVDTEWLNEHGEAARKEVEQAGEELNYGRTPGESYRGKESAPERIDISGGPGTEVVITEGGVPTAYGSEPPAAEPAPAFPPVEFLFSAPGVEEEGSKVSPTTAPLMDTAGNTSLDEIGNAWGAYMADAVRDGFVDARLSEAGEKYMDNLVLNQFRTYVLDQIKLQAPPGSDAWSKLEAAGAVRKSGVMGGQIGSGVLDVLYAPFAAGEMKDSLASNLLQTMRDSGMSVPDTVGGVFEEINAGYRGFIASLQSEEESVVAVRAPGAAAAKILQEGRFKSQFESGTSRGLLNTNARSAYEENAFGYPQDLTPSERPVYGFMYDRKNPAAAEATAEWYGDVIFLLKRDNISRRTTITSEDSLDFGPPDDALTGGQARQYAVPTPLNAVNPTAFHYTFHSAIREDIGTGRIHVPPSAVAEAASLGGSKYIEAQIHGGVSLEDVESIIIVDDNKETSRAAELAERLGIPVVFRRR